MFWLGSGEDATSLKRYLNAWRFPGIFPDGEYELRYTLIICTGMKYGLINPFQIKIKLHPYTHYYHCQVSQYSYSLQPSVSRAIDQGFGRRLNPLS